MEIIKQLEKTLSLNNNDDKEKLLILQELATATLKIDTDKSLMHAKKALALAKKNR